MYLGNYLPVSPRKVLLLLFLLCVLRFVRFRVMEKSSNTVLRTAESKERSAKTENRHRDKARDVLRHGDGEKRISRVVLDRALVPNTTEKSSARTHMIGTTVQSKRAPECKPHDNILFLKTHKTGSSTMLNIFQRYGEKNNLTFVLPFSYNLLGWPRSFEPRFALPPPRSGYNILCNHARYNRTSMKKILPIDTVFVTILREPIQQFESAFRYMNMASYLRLRNKTDPLKYFVSHPDPLNIIKKGVQSHGTYMAWNGMSFDLGMDWKDFHNEKRIIEKIFSVEQEFDLVMIAEYFEESLILLKEKLCWSLDDVVYFTMNQRPKKLRRKILDPVLAANILKWNNVDAVMYDYFNRSLWKTISSKGPTFFKEVEELKARNLQMSRVCLEDSYIRDKSVGWTEVKGFRLRDSAKTNQFCQRLVTSELKYSEMLRSRHKKLINWVEPTHAPSRTSQTAKKS